MPLVAEGKGIEEIASGTDKRHATIKVGGQQRPLTVDRIGETVAIANTRDSGDVEEPPVMEYPTVAIANHEPEVAITEAVVGHFVGEKISQRIAEMAHVHDHILVAQVDACHQRTGAAFLVLGETVGRRLGIVGVIKDVIGTHASDSQFHARKRHIFKEVAVQFSQFYIPYFIITARPSIEEIYTDL